VGGNGRRSPVVRRDPCDFSHVEVDDMDAAIYLHACGMTVLAIDNYGTERVTFHFADAEQVADGHVLQFINRQSRLQPVDFADSQKWLKKLAHQFSRDRKSSNSNARHRSGRSIIR